MASEETGDVEIVRKCLAANVPQQTSEQAVTFTAVDRTGFVTESTARLYWRQFDNGSRSTLCFSSPPDLRGSAVLLIAKEDRADIFMYLPELRKVRRINKRSVSGSVLGTDFSYEDLERLQGMSQERDLKRLEDADEDRVLKVLQTSHERVERSEAGFFPMWLRMDDAKAGTHTELVVHEIRTEHEIPEKTFTERALEQCH
jgi:hypothetical protein